MRNCYSLFGLSVVMFLIIVFGLSILAGAEDIKVITTRTPIPGVPLAEAQVAPLVQGGMQGETETAPLPEWTLRPGGNPALRADADALDPGPEFASGMLPLEQVQTIEKEAFGGEGEQVNPEDEIRPTEGTLHLVVPLSGEAEESLVPPSPFLLTSGSVNSLIPDQGWHWRRVILTGDSLPPGAVVTNLEYRLRIDDTGDPLDFYCGDYEIHLFTGAADRELMIYDNLGGRTDGGFDDDAEDDSDIYLNWRNTHFFDGDDASDWFGVWIDDVYASDEGILNYIEFYVHWEAPLPNLVCYTPDGWDGHIVASSVAGTHTDGPSLEAGATTYIDWAVMNVGASISGRFYTYLYSDGNYITGWFTDDLGEDWYAWVADYPYVFDAGPHTLCFIADVNGDVTESDETDNVCCREFSWVSPVLPNLACYTPGGWDGPIVASSVPGTHTDGPNLTGGATTYIDWAVGCWDADVPETFYSYLYCDGDYVQGWVTSGLSAGFYAYVLDWEHVFDAGTKTLCMVQDVLDDVVESDETDNECCRAFTWAVPSVPVYVDISPGKCPNRCRAGSPLMMPVAVLGTAALDVRDIDASSLRLRREGIAGEVAPRRHVYGDVATPYVADACGCHTLGGDGVEDVNLKFQMGEVSTTLGLDGLAPGTVVRLIVEGNLTDGRGMFGSDCALAVSGLWQEESLGDEVGFVRVPDDRVDPSTPVNLSFQAPRRDRVVLDIFDAQGRKVATLVDQDVSPGVHSISWDGTNAGGKKLSSGVYFASVRSSSGSDIKKLVIVR